VWKMLGKIGTQGARARFMNEDRTAEGRAAEDSELDQDMVAMAERARDSIEAFVREQPHAALGIAAAAGFILGGGLTPRRLLRIGLAAGGPALSRQLVDQVVRAASDFMEEPRQPKREKTRPTR
jgi:ElaB/YqjD/DUF883 family membrane-anchored ribosome-binding protein